MRDSSSRSSVNVVNVASSKKGQPILDMKRNWTTTYETIGHRDAFKMMNFYILFLSISPIFERENEVAAAVDAS